jgi:hypothetical protein
VAAKRIRPAPLQWGLWLAWVCFLSYAAWLLTPWPWPVLVAWVVAVGVLRALVMSRWSVTVSVQGLTWAGRRGGQLGWAEVATVGVQRDRWHSRVVVTDRAGRVTTLKAPTTGFLDWDANFEKKVRLLDDALFESRRLKDTSSAS